MERDRRNGVHYEVDFIWIAYLEIYMLKNISKKSYFSSAFLPTQSFAVTSAAGFSPLGYITISSFMHMAVTLIQE